MPRFRLALLTSFMAGALLVMACGNLLGALPDEGKSSGDDAGHDAGTDAGAPDAGDAGINKDAGTFDAGYTADGGPFTWTVAQIDTHSRLVLSVSGLGANDVYALTSVTNSSGSLLLHYNGNPQEEWVPVLSLPAPYSVGVKALPARGAVAVVSENALYYCGGDCLDGGAYQTDYTSEIQFDFACANASDAFALGQENGSLDTVLWRSSPNGWAHYATVSTQQEFFECAVAADGTVLIAGRSEVAVVFTDGGSRIETVQIDNWPNSTFGWFGPMVPVGPDMLLLSGWSVVQRTRGGMATRVFDGDEAVGVANAAAYAHPEEIFVVGRGDKTSPVLRRFQGSWRFESPWEEYVNWQDVWLSGQDDIFAVGQKKNSVGGIVGGRILHGRR